MNALLLLVLVRRTSAELRDIRDEAPTIRAVIYLDNNATTQPSKGVCEAMAQALCKLWPNPSSLHRPGQEARHAIELARREVAELVGARPREIVFTGSGTEALDLAIRGTLATKQQSVLVTDQGEHAAVRKLAQTFEAKGQPVRYLPLDVEGRVDAEALPELLAAGDVALVSVQWANNETGAIQPIERLGEICAEAGVCFHTDGTQWIGKMPTDVRSLPVDLLTGSAHKFYGPKGVGFLWIRSGIGCQPMLMGSQELGRRGGTENTPGIIGTGIAARQAQEWLADESLRDQQRTVRDRFEQRVLKNHPSARINGPTDPEQRVWNTTNIGFPRIDGQALLLSLSERGVCASGGSACSSGSIEASPVLVAMGVDEAYAHGSLRFSISKHTTTDEVDEAAAILGKCIERLSASLPA